LGLRFLARDLGGLAAVLVFVSIFFQVFYDYRLRFRFLHNFVIGFIPNVDAPSELVLIELDLLCVILFYLFACSDSIRHEARYLLTYQF